MNRTPEAVVRAFFEQVRSGRDLNTVYDLLAPAVDAHQLTAEEPTTVRRSPGEYADHVRDMQRVFGAFAVEVTEVLAQDDRVYVRWKQVGTHLGTYDGFEPTGLPVVEIASAVYRIDAGKIREYWIQIDRAGIQLQLERNARMAASAHPPPLLS